MALDQHIVKSPQVNSLRLTSREGSDITLLFMPKATVTERLRATLRRLVRDGGRGVQKALSDYSRQSPVGRSIAPQNLSYFLNPKPPKDEKNKGRVGVGLDDLDTIAAFFNMSIGELLGSPRQNELSAEEQRLIFAFRALSYSLRQHVISLTEAASLSVRVGQRLLRRPSQFSKDAASLTGAPHHDRDRDSVSTGDSGDSGDDTLSRELQRIALQLAALATGGRQHLEVRPPKGGKP